MTMRYIAAAHPVTAGYSVTETGDGDMLPHVMAHCTTSLDAAYLANLLNQITDKQRLAAWREVRGTGAER